MFYLYWYSRGYDSLVGHVLRENKAWSQHPGTPPSSRNEENFQLVSLCTTLESEKCDYPHQAHKTGPTNTLCGGVGSLGCNILHTWHTRTAWGSHRHLISVHQANEVLPLTQNRKVVYGCLWERLYFGGVVTHKLAMLL